MYQTKQLKLNTMKQFTKEQVQKNQMLIDKLRARRSNVINEESLFLTEIIINLEQNNIVLKNA